MAHRLFFFLLASHWFTPGYSATLWIGSDIGRFCIKQSDKSPQQYTLPMIHNPSACALACLREKWCKCFLYKPDSKECRLGKPLCADVDNSNGGKLARFYMAESERCPSQDGFIHDVASDACLLFVTSPEELMTSWQGAVEACEERGATLVCLHTPAIRQLVLSTLRQYAQYNSTDYFVGARRAVWNAPWEEEAGRDFQWLCGDTAVDVGDGLLWASEQSATIQDGDNVLLLDQESGFRLKASPDIVHPSGMGYICER